VVSPLLPGTHCSTKGLPAVMAVFGYPAATFILWGANADYPDFYMTLTPFLEKI